MLNFLIVWMVLSTLLLIASAVWIFCLYRRLKEGNQKLLQLLEQDGQIEEDKPALQELADDKEQLQEVPGDKEQHQDVSGDKKQFQDESGDRKQHQELTDDKGQTRDLSDGSPMDLADNVSSQEPKPKRAARLSLASSQKEAAVTVNEVHVKSPDEKLLERIIDVINRNINNSEIRTDDIAREVGISRMHLHRKMKELTGQTPHDFIRDIRLRKAAHLLSNHKTNVTEAMYACGFNNAASFSTTFKRFYGVSPREYMQQH